MWNNQINVNLWSSELENKEIYSLKLPKLVWKMYLKVIKIMIKTNGVSSKNRIKRNSLSLRLILKYRKIIGSCPTGKK